ncbi:structural maintenance of chromosomes protein 6 [Histomonas meleagridis]|uniref:structural maintenance of chromosomes protein 6 n=1 Tax=Histomonas meleagridis TaxID=135588 RepID=UPI00355A131C|nr:structural maintenance of chromosomes protein 6 [Histomonas meleagridis]KAH0806577.1 structural maintenance of chromosomes protein 6 [Histomonas meleagridis]
MRKSAIPGTLLSIRMINFMIHDNLLIELEPRVNFITGRNGSGKSSILVALSVGLGSNTKLSGRGQSLSGLIKDGRHEATISIVIQNGPNGYQFEKYGETITITRKITHSSSRFEISGIARTNSTHIREELSKILSFFNIQNDNPCSIMHQDVAREFISSSTPAKKYELFMKGTLITKLNNEIQTISNNIEKIKAQRRIHLEGNARLEQEFNEQKRLFDIVEEADGLVQIIHNLEDELVWSHYRQSQLVSDKLENELIDIRQTLSDQENRYQDCKSRSETARREFNQYKQKMQEEMEQLSSYKKEKDKLGDNLKQVQSSISSNKAQLKRCNNFIETTVVDLQTKEEELQRLENERKRAIETASIKKQQFIVQKEAEQQQLERELETAENFAHEIKNNIKYLMSERENLKMTKTEIDEHLSTISTKLRSLKSVANSASNEHNSLYNKIQQKIRSFSYPPIGPISKYIKLKDMKWGIAVQHIIGKSMNVFIVNNHNDEKILRSIIGNEIRNFTVAVYDFTKSKYPKDSRLQHIEQLDCISIIDSIVITNEKIQATNHSNVSNISDIIHNVLIDIYNADRIFCFEDEEIARKTAFETRGISTITTEGYQFKIQGGYKFIFSPKTHQCRIGIDESLRIRQLEEEQHKVRDDKNDIENRLRQLEIDLEKTKNDRNYNDSKRSELNKRLNRVKIELQTPPDEIDEFDAQLNSLKNRIQKLKNIYEENHNMEPILKEKINDLQQEKRELIKKISELSEKLNQTDSFKAESDRLFNNMRTVERELEKEQKKISQIQEKEHQIQQKSEQAKKEANDNLEKARTHSPECEDKYKTSARPPQTLATMLKEERRKYEEAQNISGLDFSQVRLKYKKTKALYEKAKRYLMEQEEFLIQSEKRIESRKEKLQVIQHSITRRAKISFLTYLKQRNYTGKLRFDHENHVIDIAVKQKADQDFTDVMNLSGGEKSYCLVSLLLALWDTGGNQYAGEGSGDYGK